MCLCETTPSLVLAAWVARMLLGTNTCKTRIHMAPVHACSSAAFASQQTICMHVHDVPYGGYRAQPLTSRDEVGMLTE